MTALSAPSRLGTSQAPPQLPCQSASPGSSTDGDQVITDENMMRYFSLSEKALTEGVPLEAALSASRRVVATVKMRPFA